MEDDVDDDDDDDDVCSVDVEDEEIGSSSSSISTSRMGGDEDVTLSPLLLFLEDMNSRLFRSLVIIFEWNVFRVIKDGAL